MNILSIDTTNTLASVALNDKELTNNNMITHSEKLMPLIHNLVRDISTIDMYGINIGPGSFTGTRISVATLKGLNQIHNKKIIGINSLELLASKYNNKTVCSILDARNDRVYYAVYENKNNIIKTIILPGADDISIVLDKVKNINIPNIYFIGDCCDKFKDKILSFNNSFKIEKNNITRATDIYNYISNMDNNVLDNHTFSNYSLDIEYISLSQAERLKNDRNN